MTRAVPRVATTMTPARIRLMASRKSTRSSHRRRYRSIHSRIALGMATSGPPDIGATLAKDITGYLARGRVRRKLGSCGRPATGDTWEEDTAITMDIGGRTLAITAESIMDSDT